MNLAAIEPTHGEQRQTEAPLFSIVAPVYNEAETLPHFYRRLTLVMEALQEAYELILIDDGSTDGSTATVRHLFHHDHRVRVLTFSRNFGHQAAISAGLDHARGRAVIIMDTDLQDPPEIIPQLTCL